MSHNKYTSPMGLPIVTMSGDTPWPWKPQKASPTRPKPHCTWGSEQSRNKERKTYARCQAFMYQGGACGQGATAPLLALNHWNTLSVSQWVGSGSRPRGRLSDTSPAPPHGGFPRGAQRRIAGHTSHSDTRLTSSATHTTPAARSTRYMSCRGEGGQRAWAEKAVGRQARDRINRTWQHAASSNNARMSGSRQPCLGLRTCSCELTCK